MEDRDTPKDRVYLVKELTSVAFSFPQSHSENNGKAQLLEVLIQRTRYIEIAKH